ncbi:MAG: PorT family protein [Bacteroidales bacterium]|nr:PorT family protein [Bacteroidales bacterium]
MKIPHQKSKWFITPLVLAFIVSLLSETLLAQNFQKGDINIGFEGGVQFTDVSVGSNYLINSPNGGSGFSFGPYVEYHVSPSVKLQIGLNYDKRAFSLNEPPYRISDSGAVLRNSYLQIERDYDINFLTIPLSVAYVKGSDKFKIYIQFSFYYSLYLNAHLIGSNDLYIDSLDYQNISDTSINIGHNFKAFDEAVEGLFNSSDFGIRFTIGGLIKLSSNLGLTIAPGFTWGMANVYEDPSINSRWSRVLKLNAGIVYTFRGNQRE